MIRFVLLLVFLLTNPVWANELIPGSYKIEYGGLYKIAADESSRFLENRWRDQEFERWQDGGIDFLELTRRNMEMTAHLNDWRYGPPWWTRHWWDSFESHKGGAPPNRSLVVKLGSNFEIINTPLFTVSNSFGFRWKALEASIDFKAKKAISIGIGEVPTPSLGWKFKASPEFKFSTMRVFDRPSKSVRRVGFRFILTHWVQRKPMVAIEVRAWYSPLRNEAFFGVQVSLLQW